VTVAADTKNAKRATNDNPEILLGLLSAIEQDSQVTQRTLSKDLGIALGLANAYLKRCVTKGLVKVSQVPLNRYAYYLTPKGFSEKSRLTAEYLTLSFNFFRDARAQCAALLETAARQGCQRLVLVGAGELAEIAILSASESPAVIVCVADGAAASTQCAGVPVVGEIAEAMRLGRADGGIDGFVITDTQAPQAVYETTLERVAVEGFDVESVMAPPMLRISMSGNGEAPGGGA
jgi:DNA-binding MarR family transcriptional regulator